MRGCAIISVSVFAAISAASAARAAPPAESASVTGLGVSPPWVSVERSEDTTVTFALPRAGTVVFTLTRVAPRCVRVGAFRVRGRAGGNRFLFPGRLDRRLLLPGTYRLTAPGTEGRVARAIVVLARGERTGTVGRALRRDACAPPRRGGVLGAARVETDGDVGPPRLLVVACLLVAVGAFGLALLPAGATRGARAAELLASRRSAVVAVGGAALAAGSALYLASAL